MRPAIEQNAGRASSHAGQRQFARQGGIDDAGSDETILQAGMLVVKCAQLLHRGADGGALFDDGGKRRRINIHRDAPRHDAIHHETVAEHLIVQA